MLLITNGVMVSGSSELSCRDQIRSHMTAARSRLHLLLDDNAQTSVE